MSICNLYVEDDEKQLKEQCKGQNKAMIISKYKKMTPINIKFSFDDKSSENILPFVV